MNGYIIGIDMKNTSFIFITLYMVCAPFQVIQAQQLAGEWNGTIYFANLNAELQTTIILKQSENAIEGHSVKNAAGRVLGGFKGGIAKLFMKKKFKKGALLQLRNGTIKSDTLKLVLYTVFKSTYWFVAPLTSDTLLEGVLMDGAFKVHGGFRFRKQEVVTKQDFNELGKALLAATSDRIFRKDILQEKSYQAFEKQFTRVSGKVRDDLEFYSAFYYYAKEKNKLPFTHYKLTRPADKISIEHSPLASVVSSRKKDNSVSLTFPSDSVALMTITSFAYHPVASIDSVFTVLKDRQIPNCIIDLRTNLGGTISSMRIAEHLVDTATYAGFFLTNKWFDEQDQIPTPEQYALLPELDESNLGKLRDGIHTTSGFKLKVVPTGQPYLGKVFLLTSARTASACEPLCYNLKYYQKAILVGQTTSGAMLSGESFLLDNGWDLDVPTADYYASDGYRIDLKGVIPDYTTAKGEELDFVLNALLKK